jgi:alkanesulfonate monooxygenase SsuD/methylene tetrahydromethanopterin reductase-like flavin-dependent oxidoreductase (luciferase family)
MTGLQFGLSVSSSVSTEGGPVAAARAAEEMGYDFVSAFDHPAGTEPTYETWTMLSWIAASTSQVKVATRVLGVPYRNPAMVAKMAETFDRLSRGRLILGLGGGSTDEEFRAFGIRVPPPREKIDGLEEAVRITRGLWSQPGFTYHGRLYRTDRAELEPKPSHRIPIWLGTFGRRALTVTGRLADGWIPSFGHVPLDNMTAMRERVLEAARAAGRDPAQITCAFNVQARVDERAQPGPSLVAGSPARVTGQVLSFVKLGFTAFNFTLTGPGVGEQVERLAREVIPAVRAGV